MTRFRQCGHMSDICPSSSSLQASQYVWNCASETEPIPLVFFIFFFFFEHVHSAHFCASPRRPFALRPAPLRFAHVLHSACAAACWYDRAEGALVCSNWCTHCKAKANGSHSSRSQGIVCGALAVDHLLGNHVASRHQRACKREG